MSDRFGVAPGERAVVFTAGDDGWRTAYALAEAGVEVAAVVDPRERSRNCAERAPASRFCRRAVVERARWAVAASTAVEVRDSDAGTASTIDVRSACRLQRLEPRPPSDLSSRGQAGVERGDQRLRAPGRRCRPA